MRLPPINACPPADAATDPTAGPASRPRTAAGAARSSEVQGVQRDNTIVVVTAKFSTSAGSQRHRTFVPAVPRGPDKRSVPAAAALADRPHDHHAGLLLPRESTAHRRPGSGPPNSPAAASSNCFATNNTRCSANRTAVPRSSRNPSGTASCGRPAIAAARPVPAADRTRIMSIERTGGRGRSRRCSRDTRSGDRCSPAAVRADRVPTRRTGGRSWRDHRRGSLAGAAGTSSGWHPARNPRAARTTPRGGIWSPPARRPRCAAGSKWEWDRRGGHLAATTGRGDDGHQQADRRHDPSQTRARCPLPRAIRTQVRKPASPESLGHGRSKHLQA